MTPQQSNLLYHLILKSCTLSDVADQGCLEAFAALKKDARTPLYTEVHIVVNNGATIQGIKLLRTLMGWGLKEAKDWWDDNNPHRLNGKFGPLLKLEDPVAVKEIKNRIYDGEFLDTPDAYIVFEAGPLPE